MKGSSDVLVVGAGPTGCAAGIVLARAGVDVMVVDRATFPRDKTCGDAVSNDGILLLAELGARHLVEAGPHTIVRRAAAVFPDGTRIGRDYESPGYIVPRLHLDDCTRRALEASGAKLLQDTRVTSLTRSGDAVTGAAGPDFEWSAKVVIAADGYGSVGLAALGESKPEGRYLAISATGYYRGVTFPHGEATSDHFFDAELPLGYGWIFPAVDGVSNVGVYLRMDAYARVGRSLKELFSSFIARHEERFAGSEPVVRQRVWSLPIAPRPIRITCPGLILAGDAAGFIDPLSGEGIWQGLHTGMLSGKAAADAVRRGRAFDDVLGRRYEAECRRDIARPSRGKAAVQRAITFIVDNELYRLRAVRAALSWGYEHRALEMTKS